MATWRRIALIVILISVVVGSIFGILVRGPTPPGQKFSFSANAVQTSEPVSCPKVFGNYSVWLEIQVIGNRTNFNYQSVTVIGISTRVQVQIPLNSTTSQFADIMPVNSTLEIIFVPLPTFYWAPPQNLDATLTFFISGFEPQTKDLGQIPLRFGTISC